MNSIGCTLESISSGLMRPQEDFARQVDAETLYDEVRRKLEGSNSLEYVFEQQHCIQLPSPSIQAMRVGAVNRYLIVEPNKKTTRSLERREDAMRTHGSEAGLSILNKLAGTWERLQGKGSVIVGIPVVIYAMYLGIFFAARLGLIPVKIVNAIWDYIAFLSY